MTVYQPVDRRLENDSKHTMISQHSTMNYCAAPLEESGSTGIRSLLLKSLSANCGSGSWCDAVFPQLKETISRDYSIGDWTVISLPSGETAEEFSPPTIAEKLDEIRDAFGLSMAALADVLKVSRASVYNWLENEPRGTNVVQRIETLYNVAQGWKGKNPYHYAPGKLMKQKLGDGPSMFDRLCREELDMDKIHSGMDSLLLLMNKQRERMDRAKARSAKIPAGTEGHRELLERLTGSVTADK